MSSTRRAGTEVLAAQRATYVAFVGAGFAFASWAARIPQVRDRMHLTPAALGLVLLAVAAGSIVALLLAGVIVHRVGSRRTVEVMAVLAGVALVVVALGYLAGIGLLVAGLAVFGFGLGAWDVAMNVQGARVERELGRAIMPRFHAGFSVGTVAGALLGAAMVAIGVPVTLHLLVVGLAQGVLVPLAARAFVADSDDHVTEEGGQTRRALARWAEPRTLLVGVFVLAFTFAEGTGNDWIGVALIDSYRAPAVVGTLGLALFLAAMTTARWFGPAFLDRYGRVAVLRALAGVAVVGVALFVFSPAPAPAFVGIVLWGAGTSLGFPAGMSAAADEPAAAAGRVSVVASIGYCAFLAGPTTIGFLGERVTVLRALTTVGAMLALAAMLAGALRPPRASRR